MKRWRRRRRKLPQRVSSLTAMEMAKNQNYKLTRTAADNGQREAKEAAELVKILLSKV